MFHFKNGMFIQQEQNDQYFSLPIPEQAFDNFYKLHRSATTRAEARIRYRSEDSELPVPDSLDAADVVPLLMILYCRVRRCERVEALGYKESELMCATDYNSSYLRCGGMRRSGILALADATCRLCSSVRSQT